MRIKFDINNSSRLDLQIEVHGMLATIYRKQCKMIKLDAQQLAYKDTNIEKEKLEVMYWNLKDRTITKDLDDPTFILFKIGEGITVGEDQ